MSFSQVAPLPTIKDVVLEETIGQGSFGCVKRAHLKVDPSLVIAVKFVHIPTCKQNDMTEKDITREVVLQSKCSKHPNILRVIDCNIANEFLWVVMELADGGDLFDKIEPDVGVDSEVAQFYFQQLIRAISYLHEECGVAHRDIKPENILLDKNGNLKLADFGLASQFKRKDGSWRASSDQRGSPPYMAPEVLHSQQYYAPLTDIWSIGILLFVILTGELPWELPIAEDEHFSKFIENDGNISLGPWAKIELQHLNLLRKILQPDPNKRVRLESLRDHPWLKAQCRLSDRRGLCKDPALLAKRLFSKLKVSLSDDDYMRFTQGASNTVQETANYRFTQPLHNEVAHIQRDPTDTDATVASQRAFTQFVQLNESSNTLANHDDIWTQYVNNDVAALQFSKPGNPIPRSLELGIIPSKLTKFYSLEDMESILSVIEKALQLLRIKVKPDLYGHYLELTREFREKAVYPVIITIKCEKSPGNLLTGSIKIFKISTELKIISFDRKSGDPLQWRRLFKRLALFCRAIILVPS